MESERARLLKRLNDLVIAARVLRRTPVATGAGILLLALGIGINCSIFSVFSSLFLRPLDFPEPSRLVQLETVQNGRLGQYVSDRHYAQWRDNSTVFRSLAASTPPDLFSVQWDSETEWVSGSRVTNSFFETFGLELAAGPGFTLEEPPPGPPTEVVIGHELWLSRFAGDPTVLGHPLDLGGRSLTLVGVLSATTPPPFELEVLLPLAIDASVDRGYFGRVTGRLRDGVDLESALQELRLVHSRGLERAGLPADAEGVSLRPFQQFRFGGRKPTLLLLLSASGFLLLLACANVANLQLVRVAPRAREIAIRQALGASTRRALNPLLVETLLLAGAGAALGLMLTIGLNRWLVAVNPTILESAPLPVIDWRVLGFVLATTLLAALATVPSLQAVKKESVDNLRQGTSTSAVGRRARLGRQLLVASEIALTVLAVLTATLLIRSYNLLEAVDPGFNPGNVFALELRRSGTEDAAALRLGTLTSDLLVQFDGLPGVTSVGATTSLPVQSTAVLPYIDTSRYVPGPAREGQVAAQFRGISPTYLETMQIPLLHGRGFVEADRDGSPPVALVSETAAQRHWPGEDPIGKRVDIFPDSIYEHPPRTVVGVVGDVSELGLGESRRWDSLYVPLDQMADPLGGHVLGAVFIVVKSDADSGTLIAAMRERVRALGANHPMRRVTSMNEVLRRSLAPQEFRAAVTSGFGALALILASVGIYGVLAFLASSRSREFAIRTALGSTPRRLTHLVLVQGTWPLAVGIAVGLSGAFAVRQVAARFLFGVTATDPASLLAVVLVVGGTTLIAMLVPAWRAATTDPTLALRGD